MHIVDLHGRKLPVIGLDFESFYEDAKGARFTLKKMTTTLYVRDPIFRAHGASIRLPGDKKAWWVSHCELRDVLREFDWSNTALLCQNTAFDGLILSHHYGHVPAYYLDTLSMSRGEWGVHVPHNLSQIGERLGNGTKLKGVLEKTAGIYHLPWEAEKDLIPYANQDVDLMWDNFDTLYYEHNYPEEELHIIDTTIRGFCDPRVLVDRALCEEEALEEVAKKSRLVEAAGVDPSVLASNPKFAKLLRSRGVEPPMKISPATNKPTYAFAKGDLNFQKLQQDERVSDIILARKAIKSTIGETRARRMIEHSYPTLPIMLHYCGAHTHRWSAGDNINIQNLPAARKGQSTRLRRSLTAPPGYVIVVVDSSQIEARVNAWAAGEEGLLKIFREGGDPYVAMASDIFRYEVIKGVHKAERHVGKTAELGAGFGMGAAKFAYTVRSGQMGPPIDISDELAADSIKAYRKKRKAIVAQWNALDAALVRMYYGERFELGPWEFQGNNVMMPNGLFIRYPGLTGFEGPYGLGDFVYDSRKGWTSLYGGKFDENLVQSTARTVVAQQALKIAERYHIIFLVHDEVLYLAREEEADEALAYGIQCLRTPPSFCPDLPVDAEGGYAVNYSK